MNGGNMKRHGRMWARGDGARRLLLLWCGASLLAVLLSFGSDGRAQVPTQQQPTTSTTGLGMGDPEFGPPEGTELGQETSLMLYRREPTELPTPAVPPVPERGLLPPVVPEDPATMPLDPFGSNLFLGNFLGARGDGLNPDYVVLPGDHVQVRCWGAIEFRQTFVVDGQGNIFIPTVGPIRLAGVRNADLTNAVRAGMSRVYARNFEVYTNLLTAKPVAVFVTGGVVRPGRYAGIPSDSPLFFLDQAGGIDPKLGSYRNLTVVRKGKPLASFDLYEFILRGQLPDVQFEHGDTILVGQRGPVIELRGDVAQPALLEFSKSPMVGSEALAIIPGAARATQVTVQGVREGAPFSRTLSVAAFSSYSIRDGDTIFVRAEGLATTILVKLEGEFHGPSTLAVQRGSRLIDVLNHVAVDPVLADVNAVHIRRESVAKDQKDSINDALFRLERNALLALSQSTGESGIRAKEAELTLSFVERARLVQPLGRVVTASGGVQHNLLLQQNDIIVIPPRTNVVRVSGEVMMAQALIYRPGLTAEDYIESSGGYTDRGNESTVIVIHPNAEVAMGGTGMAIQPGDEILVPPEVDVKVLQNIGDVTTILYQIAVGAGVVIALL